MAKQDRRGGKASAVTENEGAVLSLIARIQPITRHGLTQAFKGSPTTSYNTSKGTIYPLVARLIERGLVKSKAGKGSAGDSLSLTRLGQRALEAWLVEGPSHAFGHDPLIDRMMSLDGLPPKLQVRWIANAKALLLASKEELRTYRDNSDAPFMEIAHGSAMAMVDAKLEWLDRLLIEVVNTPDR